MCHFVRSFLLAIWPKGTPPFRLRELYNGIRVAQPVQSGSTGSIASGGQGDNDR